VVLLRKDAFSMGETRALLALRPDGSTESIYEERNTLRSRLGTAVYDWRRGKYYIESGEHWGLLEYDPASGSHEVVYRAPGEPRARGWLISMDIAPDCEYLLLLVDGEGLFRWEPGGGEPVRLSASAPGSASLQIVGPDAAFLIDDNEDALYGLDPETGAVEFLYRGAGRICDVSGDGRWLLEKSAGRPSVRHQVALGAVPKGALWEEDSDGRMYVIEESSRGRHFYLREITSEGVGEPQEVDGLPEKIWGKRGLNIDGILPPKFAGVGVLVYRREYGWSWGLERAGVHVFDIETGEEERVTDFGAYPLWHGPVKAP
jgi:hypothetical protein